MFLEKTIRENSALAEYAVYAHQNGLIRPDSYIVDVDTFLGNAEAIKKRRSFCKSNSGFIKLTGDK